MEEAIESIRLILFQFGNITQLWFCQDHICMLMQILYQVKSIEKIFIVADIGSVA